MERTAVGLWPFHQSELLHGLSGSTGWRLDVGAGRGACVCAYVRKACCVCVSSIESNGRVDGPPERMSSMNTRAAMNGAHGYMTPEQVRAVRVQYGMDTIKECMPNVYQQIKQRADEVGNVVFALVRAGLAGQPGCFYAFEAGHVVGQPAGVIEKDRAELGNFVARFGCAYVCIFGEPPALGVDGGGNGAP